MKRLKQYRLLKDLPFAEKGVVVLNGQFLGDGVSDDVPFPTPEWLSRFLEDQEWFERMDDVVIDDE